MTGTQVTQKAHVEPHLNRPAPATARSSAAAAHPGWGNGLPGRLPAASSATLLALQRLAGNRATCAVVTRPAPAQRSSCSPTCGCASCSPGEAQRDEESPVQRGFLDSAIHMVSDAVTGVENAAKSVGEEFLTLATCGPELAALALTVSADIQAVLLRHIKELTLPGAADAEALAPVVEKAAADGICACLTDQLIAAVALHVYLAGEPLAQAHLEHYLHGGGAPFNEDIADMFARNPTVRTNVGVQIGEVCGGGRVTSGVLEGGADLPDGSPGPGMAPITQLDWDDQDWRNAVGNVDKLQWTIVSGPDASGNAQVQITLTDAYAWHPKEARISQCAHQALENMKSKGAADFTSVGTGTVQLNLGAAAIIKEPTGPR